MHILVVAGFLPMFDRASGYLRFFTLLKLLSQHHEISYYCYGLQAQKNRYGKEEVGRYATALFDLGIGVSSGSIKPILINKQFDLIVFEFYKSATLFLTSSRIYQPNAFIVVDTVDVHFHRMESKATLTKRKKDKIIAQRIKKDELCIYQKSDLVIAVSEEDKKILVENNDSLEVEVIPNIHAIPEKTEFRRESNSLIFVGSFTHEPNVDAIIYFCAEVQPLIRQNNSGVRLRIIGHAPPTKVTSLASEHVEVLGYVPSIAEYLEKSAISIAPLRFGGGIKGKIGEAMAHGLPVVTTSVGAEGFGSTPGEHLLIADTAHDFAHAIMELLSDEKKRLRLGANARQFIEERFSEKAAERRLVDTLLRATSIRPKQVSWSDRAKYKARMFFDDRVKWRFQEKNHLQ
jgi:glycosyltransferase involved in cell wall biosynthesis